MEKQFNLDARSKIKNLCPYAVSFTLPNSRAEVILEGGKTTTLLNSELSAMCENNEIMFCGTGNGDHARIFIDNADTREYVGFDIPEEKKKQFILTDDECKKIVELKTFSSFQKNVQDKIKFNHEGHILMEYCRKTKLNEYNKIQFLEEYTGIKY